MPTTPLNGDPVADQTPTQHPVPAPSPETPRTAEDFRAIANFIRDRVSDEHRAAGALSYYLDQGVTIRAHIPRNFEGFRDTAQEHTAGWLADHTPERGLAVTDALGSLADELASQMNLTESLPAWSFRSEMAWNRMVAVARLWREHPDFQRRWEDGVDCSKD
jgi:hypothetical protein